MNDGAFLFGIELTPLFVDKITLIVAIVIAIMAFVYKKYYLNLSYSGHAFFTDLIHSTSIAPLCFVMWGLFDHDILPLVLGVSRVLTIIA